MENDRNLKDNFSPAAVSWVMGFSMITGLLGTGAAIAFFMRDGSFSPSLGLIATAGVFVVAGAALRRLFPERFSAHWVVWLVAGASSTFGTGSALQLAANTLHYPVHIVVEEQECTKWQAAENEANVPENERFPCRYTAYFFRGDHGGVYAYGYSANVAGQCFFINGSPGVAQRRDFDAPPMRDVPEKCLELSTSPALEGTKPLPWN